MNRADKEYMIKGILTKVEAKIAANFHQGKIPENWNGKQLRQYLADCVSEYILNMSPEEKRDYLNDVVVNNL